jgi:hypothetical protein
MRKDTRMEEKLHNDKINLMESVSETKQKLSKCQDQKQKKKRKIMNKKKSQIKF